MQKRLTDCRHDSKKTFIGNLIYKNLSTFAFPKEGSLATSRHLIKKKKIANGF